jgi:hypothetical protein
VRSTARVSREGEETKVTETAPILEVMERSGLVVTEGAIDEGAPDAEAEQTVCWGPSASEGPQKHDLTMFLEYNV